MTCLDCEKAPICHAQTLLYKARLKDILLAIDRMNGAEAKEMLLKFIGFLDKLNSEITER